MKKNAIATASLADYAAVINDEHRAAYASAVDTMGHVRIAGEHLLKAKAALKHGEWLPWLSSNVDVSDRQARTYMTVAANWKDISAKLEVTSNLTIEGALKALAKPKTEQKAYAPQDTRGKAEHVIADDPAPDVGGSASGPAEPEPQKSVRPIKPAEVEQVVEENKELSARISEMAEDQSAMREELEFLRRVEDAGDKLREALDEVKRLQGINRALEERLKGMQNEKNTEARWVKFWKSKYEKLSKKTGLE